jgi:hypothetical protein
MTTIAADPKLGIMVCDSNVTDGIQKWPEIKVERIGDTLYGAAGDAVDGEKFYDWIRAGAKGRRPKLDADAFNALALNAKGLFWFDNKLHPLRHREASAVGSGASAVRAALIALRECGWQGDRPDLVRAVEIACEVDAMSALPVQVYRVGGK